MIGTVLESPDPEIALFDAGTLESREGLIRGITLDRHIGLSLKEVNLAYHCSVQPYLLAKRAEDIPCSELGFLAAIDAKRDPVRWHLDPSVWLQGAGLHDCNLWGNLGELGCLAWGKE